MRGVRLWWRPGVLVPASPCAGIRLRGFARLASDRAVVACGYARADSTAWAIAVRASEETPGGALRIL